MELQTISDVSKQFSISTRTLRYYEQIGLISPIKKEDFAYRTYDEDTIKKLGQIIVLRKLRIPLKQIAEILKSDSAKVAIEVFERNLSEVDEEITSLSTIRSIIEIFIQRLNLSTAKFALPDDESLLEIIDALTVSKTNPKKEKTMEELNQASEKLNKLSDKDVRIVYLPPATVASIHTIGGTPELDTDALSRQFIKKTRLDLYKPDFKYYGFNHPDGTKADGSDHGYERWLTIPDNWEVEAPFVKKKFPGGSYAAHMIPMGAFEEWHWLWKWAEEHEQIEINLGDAACMSGLLEEHLNFKNLWSLDISADEMDKLMQLDLLIPIKDHRADKFKQMM